MRRYLSRLTTMILMTVALAGCAEFSDGSLFQKGFWSKKNTLPERPHAELGIAELAKGNFSLAGNHLDAAVTSDPTNVYALYARAVLFEHAGDLAQARSAYEQILTLRPPETSQMIALGNLEVVPVDRSAERRLGMIDNGQRQALGVAESQISAERLGPPDLASAIQGAAGGSPFDAQKLDVIKRFEILRTLRDANLVTPMEYAERRNANIGALLPMTSPPPAAGLMRQIPAAEEVQSRLQAIARALEMRAMTIGQHDSERAVIIDAILPPAPSSLETPALPPTDILGGADMVRRIERLKDIGLISDEEYARERAAIVASLEARDTASQPAKAAIPASQAASSVAANQQPPKRGVAVHLASYRSEKAAARGWALLRRTYGSQLGGLNSDVSRIDLGARKGIYYRLKAGPLPDSGAARALCRELKQRRQYCEPSFMGSG